MSRSGYSYDFDDNWVWIRYRGAVESAIRGKRGQKLLSDLAVALDAMPNKELFEGELLTETGEMCALGALGVARGMDMTHLDPYDIESVAGAFSVNEKLVREIVYMNDEAGSFYPDSPAWRWRHVRGWVSENLRRPEPPQPTGED